MSVRWHGECDFFGARNSKTGRSGCHRVLLFALIAARRRRVEPRGGCNDDVQGHEQHALHPVRFAVPNQIVHLRLVLELCFPLLRHFVETYQENSNKQHSDLEVVEHEREISPADDPSQHDHEG